MIDAGGPALDALLALVRVVHGLVVPDSALMGVVAVLATVAALAVCSVLVASIAARLTAEIPRTGPAPDLYGAPRTARPDWARPDAPGRRRPRAPALS